MKRISFLNKCLKCLNLKSSQNFKNVFFNNYESNSFFIRVLIKLFIPFWWLYNPFQNKII